MSPSPSDLVAAEPLHQPHGSAATSSGSCDPLTNGEGVYFGKLADPRSKDYCLPGLCPEAFINGSGGMTLLGRSRAGKPGQGTGEGHITERQVFVSVNGGDDLAVTRIASRGGALT